MKLALIAFAALGLAATAAHADDKTTKPMNSEETAPGTTGAMKTPTAPSVATDPEQVKAQQGDAAKESAGTVGAAPGAATNSQTSSDKSK